MVLQPTMYVIGRFYGRWYAAAAMNVMTALFHHNVWANRRLLDACESLTDAQLDATVAGTAGTIRDTLKHLVGAEERYVDALRGEYGKSPARESQPWPGVPVLRDALAASGQALIELSQATEDGAIVRGVRRGEPFEMPAWHFFVQSINHATEHRSHVATILTQQGIEPPSFDSWTYLQEGAP